MRWWPRSSVHELSGAYAVDAVPESERKRFERHLASCPACQREVQGLQETATRFGAAVSEPPPPGLKPRVMAAAAAWLPAPESSPVVRSHPSLRPDWVRRLAIPLAAACVALAVALGVLVAVERGQVDSTQKQEDAIADILSAPGVRVISRKASAGGGIVTVDLASSLHELVVTSDDMPRLPASEAYQLWTFERSGKTASDGLLSFIPDHRTAPDVASGITSGDKMDVTVEPAGGTAKPTTAPIVSIPLPF
jgi:anti-sigma-K factor RskA